VSQQSAPALNAAQVAELVKLGAAIESFYGTPQDIEWCLVNDTFSIV
jgi:pyruvate,water dikinase